MIDRYLNKINKKEFNPDSHTEKTVEDYMDKLGEDYGDEMTKFVDSLQKDFKKRTADRNIEMQSDYSITVPKISVRSVWGEALNTANKKIETQVSNVGSDRGLFRKALHFITFNIFKDDENRKKEIRKTRPQQLSMEITSRIVPELTTHKTRLQENIDDLINYFCNRYQSEFNAQLQKREQYIEELNIKKKTNEELKNELSCLEEEKKNDQRQYTKMYKSGRRVVMELIHAERIFSDIESLIQEIRKYFNDLNSEGIGSEMYASRISKELAARLENSNGVIQTTLLTYLDKDARKEISDWEPVDQNRYYDKRIREKVSPQILETDSFLPKVLPKKYIKIASGCCCCRGGSIAPFHLLFTSLGCLFLGCLLSLLQWVCFLSSPVSLISTIRRRRWNNWGLILVQSRKDITSRPEKSLRNMFPCSTK